MKSIALLLVLSAVGLQGHGHPRANDLDNKIYRSPPAKWNPLAANATLQPTMYRQFGVGAILPTGWMLDQLNLQASGLAGHLQEFYQYVNQSIWVGGNVSDPDPNMLERVPYWLNGMIPTAYILADDDLRVQVDAYVNYILDHQNSTGWFGPLCCYPWPQWLLDFALLQYYEATNDPRILPAIDLNLQSQAPVLQHDGLWGYAQVRWEELLVTIYYMYDNYPAGNKTFYLEFASYAKSIGFDWAGFYNSSAFPTTECTYNCCTLVTHGVNTGEALKSSAVWWRQSQDQVDIDSTKQRFQLLWQYHGTASGVFSCSEHLAGLMPSQGTELCTVVEIMFSLETIFSIWGGVEYLDLLEAAAFNALPAAITKDMWAHVYLTESNAINAQHSDPAIWTSDGPDSNIYGLEPNYGCCTVNFPQGWSKLVTHAIMATQDDGYVLLIYTPVSFTDPDTKTVIEVTTNYPFDETATISVSATTAVPMYVPIPTWCTGASVQLGDQFPVTAPAGQLFRVMVPANFNGTITVNLPMSIRLERRFNDAVSIYYGPLLFSLKFDEDWSQLNYYDFNSSDWQIEAGSPWQYALLVDETNPAATLNFTRHGPPSSTPFSRTNYPVSITAQGRLIADQWPVETNAAAPPPQSPVQSSSPLVTLTLIPHGSTELRIAEFPTLAN